MKRNPRVMLDCSHVDTCLSDYWSGHHLPHIQIAAEPKMTLQRIKEALRDELKQGVVMGSDDEARLLAGDNISQDEEIFHDHLYKAALAAVNRIEPATKGQRTFFNDLDPQGGDDPTVYAYFVFVDITPEHWKRMYWLRSGDDDLSQAVGYTAKADAIASFRYEAEQLADMGQEHTASLHIADTLDEVVEYPDFVLRLGPRGGVEVVAL